MRAAPGEPRRGEIPMMPSAGGSLQRSHRSGCLGQIGRKTIDIGKTGGGVLMITASSHIVATVACLHPKKEMNLNGKNNHYHSSFIADCRAILTCVLLLSIPRYARTHIQFALRLCHR